VTPKAVIFDLGKVLLDFDWHVAARRLAARTRLTPKELLDAMVHSPLLDRFERGFISAEQLCAEVRRLTGFDGTFAEFREFFADIFTEMPEMTALHATVRARGTPTYILSNTNTLAVEFIRQRFPFFAHFDGYVFSFEHGAMKPELKLYEVAEQLSGRRGAELLFIDDRPEHVVAGEQRGWQGIVQETPAKTRAAFARLGLLG
jgi:glucose-1-phosphatase